MTTTHTLPAKITDARTRYAALVALQTAIAKMVTRAKADVIRAEDDTDDGVTLLGAVHITRTAPAPVIDEEALITWALYRQPQHVETIERMIAEHRAALVADLDVIGGQVVLRSTGEAVPFATVSEPGRPTVTYPNSDARRHAVEWATVMVEDEHGENLLTELVQLAARETAR